MAASSPSPFSLGLAPLILRVAVGLIFAWSGLAKWMGTMQVKGEDAAVLANIGVLASPAPTPQLVPSTAPPAAPSPSAPPAKPLPASPPRSGASVSGGSLALILAQTTPGSPVAGAPPAATAADFPEDVPCRFMWGIALAVHKASHPAADPQTGARPMSTWPRTAGEGVWLKVFAFGVLVAELGGGVLLLLGLFTRLGAFAIASVMVGAIWLTQIGPAIQSGNATLGFLPAHDLWDVRAWSTFMLQVSLLAGALALMLLGSGALALDRAITVYRYTPAPSSSPARTGGASGKP